MQKKTANPASEQIPLQLVETRPDTAEAVTLPAEAQRPRTRRERNAEAEKPAEMAELVQVQTRES